jgi:3-hydroxyisobutyrate dehydrogenase-like beta-hydroxyacid dehydrogenase
MLRRMRVGLLYPGEMGAAIGTALLEPPLWASEGRSQATARRASAFDDVGGVQALIERSEVILSVCPPAIAEETAARVAELGFDGLYVDANAISPRRMERIAGRFARCIDGSIMAKTRINVYLSGDPADAAEVVALFAADGDVQPIVLGAHIGAASAIKMAFGGWNKISAGLEAQAFAIARAYGVEHGLVAEGVDPGRVARSAAKAWRWVGEMNEVADTCADLGLPEGVARGAAELFGRWDHRRDDFSVPLERLLDELRS